ncbi:MAG: hypothetical protein LV479_10410 [Methylacidiphilales bacterium]|nr:hypothetical protein [Candidatus Methylacidiphilales bacterium]
MSDPQTDGMRQGQFHDGLRGKEGWEILRRATLSEGRDATPKMVLTPAAPSTTPPPVLTPHEKQQAFFPIEKGISMLALGRQDRYMNVYCAI